MRSLRTLTGSSRGGCKRSFPRASGYRFGVMWRSTMRRVRSVFFARCLLGTRDTIPEVDQEHFRSFVEGEANVAAAVHVLRSTQLGPLRARRRNENRHWVTWTR